MAEASDGQDVNRWKSRQADTVSVVNAATKVAAARCSMERKSGSCATTVCDRPRDGRRVWQTQTDYGSVGLVHRIFGVDRLVT